MGKVDFNRQTCYLSQMYTIFSLVENMSADGKKTIKRRRVDDQGLNFVCYLYISHDLLVIDENKMQELQKLYDELKVDHSFYKTMYERKVAEEQDPPEVDIILNKEKPSSITWDKLHKAEFVPTFLSNLSSLIEDCDASQVKQSSVHADALALLRMEKLILENSQPSNDMGKHFRNTKVE